MNDEDISTGEVGFSPAQISNYITETLDNYVRDDIITPIALGFKAIIDVDVRRYWHSPIANDFAERVTEQLHSLGWGINENIRAIENKIINAYNYWAMLHRLDKMSNWGKSVIIPGLTDLIRFEYEPLPTTYTKNVMNIKMIQSHTLPEIDKIISNAKTAVDNVPVIQGFFDDADQQTLAYEASLRELKNIIDDRLTKLRNVITESMNTAIDDTRLAEENVTKTLNA